MIEETINPISITASAFSAAAHVMAFLQFHLLFDSLGLPSKWYIETTALIAISLMIAVFLLFFRRYKLLSFFLLLFRFALIAVVGYPLGNCISVELTLLTALVFESVLYLSTGFGVFLSLTAIVASLLLQRESLAWSRNVSRVSTNNLLYLGLYPAVVAALAVMLKHYQVLAIRRKQYMERLKKSSSRLVEVNLELQEHIIRKEDEAVLGERKRLSRELHDIIGHTLMSIILMMKAAVRLSDKRNQRLREFLFQTRGQAQKGLDETRRALRELRSFNTPKISLVSAVNRMIKAFEGTHVQVLAEFGNIPWSFGETVDSVIYRIVQEGITNAIRHGDAHKITVVFWLENDIVCITVGDNGFGCEEFVPGLGLKGIQERVGQLEGSLETKNSAQGFQLTVSIPLRSV